MSCCGRRTSSLPVAVPASTRPAPPMPQAANVGTVLLRLRERARVRVRGPVTGRTYEFSAERPVQHVDRRDADVLERTSHFVRAWPRITPR